jgi:hypothetical protein
VSQARPAAFMGAGRRGWVWGREDRKPLFPLRRVVRIVFLFASGLGLRDVCLVGTVKVGVRPSDVVEALGRLVVRSLEVLSSLRAWTMDGRGGIAGLAFGRSAYCIGGIESSPSHPDGRLSC